MTGRLIGLVGYKHVGKDSTYDTAAASMPEDAPVRVAFADPIKSDLKPCELVLAEFGVDITTPEFKEKFRDMWVMWGTGVAREFIPDIWIRRAIPKVDAALAAGHLVFITDVRNGNEVDFILSRGGYPVRIKRPGYEAGNATEGWSIYDIDTSFIGIPEVNNVGTKDELLAGVLWAVQTQYKAEQRARRISGEAWTDAKTT